MSVTAGCRFRLRCHVITLLAIISAVCGCAVGPVVVGHWQAMEGTASVTFKPDGEFEAVDNMGMAVTGTYRLIGTDGIQFEVRHGDHETEVIDARVVREDDRLTLIFPGEALAETYRRSP